VALAVLTVAGRTYRVGCEEGQEPRLVELANLVDAKVAQLRANFGEIGDQRLLVMAGLEFADDASDQRSRAEALDKTVEALRAEIAERAAREAGLEARMAESLAAAAERLEGLARDLSHREAEADPLA
jgi:cell division protein ZapA